MNFVDPKEYDIPGLVRKNRYKTILPSEYLLPQNGKGRGSCHGERLGPQRCWTIPQEMGWRWGRKGREREQRQVHLLAVTLALPGQGRGALWKHLKKGWFRDSEQHEVLSRPFSSECAHCILREH